MPAWPFDADYVTSGSIDEFRIYNDARSASAILNNYNLGPDIVVPETTSLVLFGLRGLAFLFRRRSRK